MASHRTLMEQVSDLGKNLQQYLNLKLEFIQLNLSEKVVSLLSFIIRLLLFGIIFLLAFVFAVMALVYWIGGTTGNWPMAFLIGSGFFIFVGLILYLARRSLIDDPLVRKTVEFFDPEDIDLVESHDDQTEDEEEE